MTLSTTPFCFKSALTAAMLLAGLSFGQAAFAGGKGLDDPYHAMYQKGLAGKTVAYVPATMSMDLAQGWLQGMEKELLPLGVKIVTRDTDWNTSAGAQAITTLISEKPDVLVVQNPDLATYAKLLRKATEAGIEVVQMNLPSNFQSVVYIGADWTEVGEKVTSAVVTACKGKSNKIAIMQGMLTAASSAYTLKGVENILAQHPEVKIVSSQAGNWDANKAKAITQTVLKQHPDLCGIVGFWDNMDLGTAAAIKEAGLTGKVFLATSGGGEQKSACDQVKSGAFDVEFSYDVPTQASNLAAMVKWLLQNKGKTGVAKGSIYTLLKPITKANASIEGTCWKLGKI